MEQEFVSYEQAVALKELGFDEPCLAVTHRDRTLCSLVPAFTRDSQVEGFRSIKNSECLWEDDEDSFDGIQEVATPTYSQAFRWFREKCQAHIHPTLVMPNVYIVQYALWTSETFDTYEEAENACIDKLIELAKQQDNGK